MRLFITLLAFLTTNLFPPSVWAAMQRFDHAHGGQIGYFSDFQKENLYHDVSDKLMDHPWLSGLLEGDFHRAIIDKIMEKPQMTMPLASRLAQSYRMGQWNEEQFLQVTEELASKNWPEQLLGKKLFQELLKAEVIRRLMEEMGRDRQMLYQLVTDELAESADVFAGMEYEERATTQFLAFENIGSLMKSSSFVGFGSFLFDTTFDFKVTRPVEQIISTKDHRAYANINKISNKNQNQKLREGLHEALQDEDFIRLIVVTLLLIGLLIYMIIAGQRYLNHPDKILMQILY